MSSCVPGFVGLLWEVLLCFSWFQVIFRMFTCYLLRVFDGLVCGCEVFCMCKLVRDEETRQHTTKYPQKDV